MIRSKKLTTKSLTKSFEAGDVEGCLSTKSTDLKTCDVCKPGYSLNFEKTIC